MTGTAGALTIDTTITGAGSPGPYPLGWHFIDTSSIKVIYADTTRGIVPAFIYIEPVNGLLFSAPVDSGVVLRVHYTTHFNGLHKTYSLFPRVYIDISDTARKALPYLTPGSSSFADDNITINGFKSLGVSFGNQGQLTMEQALEVRIGGKINENTELSANLSDQGTSLQGDTREIGEIERMYVALENPRYNIIVGDQFVSLPPGGLVEGNKKIKGLSAEYTGEHVRAKAYGAISGGKFTIQSIKGQLGFQGPYYLTGNGEADLITPIPGTVKVVVDGNALREGEMHDFLIDYELGTLRFLPRYPVNDNSMIQVSYEYKAFDYQRTFMGTNLGVNTADSSLTAIGAFWYETDNKNHPIEMDLNPETLTALKQSGDKTPLILNGRTIHPNDVASQNALYRLYKLDTLIIAEDTNSHYVYSPFDNNAPEQNKGFYHVWFTSVGDGMGDYIEFNDYSDTVLVSADTLQKALLLKTIKMPDSRGYAYYYVGTGKGNYSALTPVPAPRRTMNGEITLNYKPSEWFSLTTDVAAEEEDRNTFSALDDKNNTASALATSFILGRETSAQRGIWTKGDYRFASRRFSREIVPSFERSVLWDRQEHAVRGNEIHAWKALTGLTLIPDFTTTASYGQFISNDSLLTHRAGYGASFSPGNPLHLSYSGVLLRHTDDNDTRQVNRDSLAALVDATNLAYGVRGDDEWRHNTLAENSGRIGAGADLQIKPVALNESFYFSQYRKGGRSIFLPLSPQSRDTGYSILWTQNLQHTPRPGWNIGGSSTWQLQTRNAKGVSESKQSVLLITATNDISSVKHGFSTRQQYQLSSEKASSYVQVPLFVGKGQGTHSYDSTTNWYVEDNIDGDYILQMQEVFDGSGTENVRKSSIQGNWFFKPQSRKIKGILADLSWQGTFGIDEQIRLDSALVAQDKVPSSTLLPGYASLANKYDSLISFADIFYKQEITWRPHAVEGLVGTISFRPYLRKFINFDEHGREWDCGFDKKWSRWELGLEGKLYTLYKNLSNSTDTTLITDRYLTLKQRYYIRPQFSLFAHESIGRTRKASLSGPYYLLHPGLTLRLIEKGWAEISYTWSQVNLDQPIEYPMAQGLLNGTSHSIDFIIDVSINDRFSINGNYRGNFNKVWLNVVSLEVMAYL